MSVRQHRVEVPRTDMYREQLEEFALAIRGKAQVEVGPKEALAALAVVHASIRSSERNGEAVPVAEVLEAAKASAAV